jgi:hypothetical protein
LLPVFITRIRSQRSLKMILITTTLDTPPMMGRWLWLLVAGIKRGGKRSLTGVCWWWIGLGKKFNLNFLTGTKKIIIQAYKIDDI